MPHYGLSLHSFSLYSNDIRSSSPDLRSARGRTAPLELPNRPSAEGSAGSAQPHHTVCSENALTLPKQLFVLHLNKNDKVEVVQADTVRSLVNQAKKIEEIWTSFDNQIREAV